MNQEKELGLKQNLLNIIRAQRVVEISLIYEVVGKLKYSQDNAKRRLRELTKAGLIKPVFTRGIKRNTKYISAYEWVERDIVEFLNEGLEDGFTVQNPNRLL